MTRFLPTSPWPVSMLASAGVALGITLAGAAAASAGTVDIQDNSGVLDAASVQPDASTLPASVYLCTTRQDGAKSAFDDDVRGKVSSQFPIAIGVNTGLSHSSVRIGAISRLATSAATSAETAAVASFDTTIRSTRSYTSTVTALMDSVKTSLAAALPTSTAATLTTATTRPPHSNGPGTTVIVVGTVVAVLMILVLADVFRRGRRPNPTSANQPRPVSARAPVHHDASHSGLGGDDVRTGDVTPGQDADEDKAGE